VASLPVRAASGNKESCPADLDLDGQVGITDFLDVLAGWS
jgi:hypothetical protein